MDVLQTVGQSDHLMRSQTRFGQSGVRGHDGKGKSKDLWVKCYEAGVEQLGNHTSYRRNPFSTGRQLIWAPHCVIQSTTLGREGVS